MSTRYFVSDEAENTANTTAIGTYKNSKEATAKLESQMSALGEKLGEFARALKQPSGYAFRASQDDITVGQPEAQLRRPVAELKRSDFDWQHLIDMLSNYEKARTDKRDSAARLRAIGLDIVD
jgi:hypothetical protein